MATKETRSERLDRLRADHRALDVEIETMVAAMVDGGDFDQIAVQRLKKRKLQLKDEIARLESAILPDIIA